MHASRLSYTNFHVRDFADAASGDCIRLAYQTDMADLDDESEASPFVVRGTPTPEVSLADVWLEWRLGPQIQGICGLHVIVRLQTSTGSETARPPWL